MHPTGQSLGIQIDESIRKALESSERFKANHFDEPLTDLGMEESCQIGKNLMKHLVKPESFAYLYASPYTHCIQTAIQISKGLKDAGGKELKLRVEYGLAENINFGQDYWPKISEGTISEDFFPTYFYKDREGNLKYPPFDNHLSHES